MIEVLVVSGVRLHRDGLCGLLGGCGGISVWGEALDAGDAAGLMKRAGTPPDVAVIDLAATAGADEALRVRDLCPGVAVVSVGLADSDADVLVLAEAGVVGFLTRVAGPDEPVAALECAARGEVLCSPRIAAAFVRRLGDLSRDRPDAGQLMPLTGREFEIAELITNGLTNKQIARRLSIELPTVKNHVHHILEKLDVKRRGEVGPRLGLRPTKPVLQGDTGTGPSAALA
jgi:DNA-binding NarL/FixJ family response regulator